MARKFIAGVLAGTVVSGLGLGVASMMVPLPQSGTPQAGAMDLPAGSEFNSARDDTGVELPGAEDGTAVTVAPEISTPDADDLSLMETADTEPAGLPETGLAQGDLSAPQSAMSEAETSDMTVDVGADDPVLPSPQTTVPEAPMTEEPLAEELIAEEPTAEAMVEDENLSISTDPEQPVLLDIEGESAAFPDAELAEVGAAPVLNEATQTPDIAQDTPTEEMEVAALPEAVEPVDDATQDSASDMSEAVAEPEVVEAAEEPSGTVGNLAENVETGRLPSVGDVAEDGSEASAEEVVSAVETPAEPVPALKAFATPFENPEGKPEMAIVLIDDGKSAIDLAALSAFPYPLSFAVDPTNGNATEAMRRYRDAGFEVLVMVDLPDGASAADTETSMQVILAQVPEAVAVIEGSGSGLQSSRAAAEQLAPILLETGHGLVLNAKGLDTSLKLISREGVPAQSVFRDVDAKGQNATVIRRFLDQAAFKAGREEGGVIIVGRLRADTVSALLIWGLQDRAGQLALAPVSTVLSPKE